MGDARLTVVVAESGAGQRLDRYCAATLPAYSRTRIQSLNAAGAVRVNGRARPDSHLLAAGDTIEIEAGAVAQPAATRAVPAPQSIDIAVVYEDESLVVVNKPAGLVVHPAHGNWDGTLVNALLGRGTTLAGLGGGDRPGVVHRLDKDTSGVMVLAKTDASYRALTAEIKERRFDKTYHAIVFGNLRAPRVTVDEPVARHRVHRQRMAVVPGGRPAATEVIVVDTYYHFDYIRATTRTGRTHQIRVHLAHIDNPLLGDSVYGGRRQRIRTGRARSRETIERLLKIMRRHALHASVLSFTHPETARRMTFTTALPADMRLALETLYREDRAKEV
ncbi:MAG: RluA family pseudouridine synthase [Candidatus Krumholzibacteria bacterium]|nr:RluA family pseudouridine synthase [Candidatus Krumholzibacteria bacterium]MDH4337197.1 RluA family pseudouridine synthase [Candidatus Krumholzibacteria bacterium]MDH5268660.1 RluA family pseudouridine synthase [Candidatus Krumholzibacteria bacterium]